MLSSLKTTISIAFCSVDDTILIILEGSLKSDVHARDTWTCSPTSSKRFWIIRTICLGVKVA